MKTFRLGISFISLLSLTGCAEYEQWERQQQQAQMAAMQAQDDSTCRSYGATPGSPAYIQCRIKLDNRRAQMDENNRVMATQYLLRR